MEILIHTALLMFLPLPIHFTRESKGSLILAEGLRDSESVLEADHNLLLRKKKLQLSSLSALKNALALRSVSETL